MWLTYFTNFEQDTTPGGLENYLALVNQTL